MRVKRKNGNAVHLHLKEDGVFLHENDKVTIYTIDILENPFQQQNKEIINA